MQLPREVLIGQNVVPLVGETLSRLGIRGRALVVTGPSVKNIAANAVIESLIRVAFTTETTVTEGATTEYVSQVEDKIQEFKPDIVVGVGGGKDIEDVAKLSSMHRSLAVHKRPDSCISRWRPQAALSP